MNCMLWDKYYKYMVNLRLLVSVCDVFFMFANTCLHVTSCRHSLQFCDVLFYDVKLAIHMINSSISERSPGRSHRCLYRHQWVLFVGWIHVSNLFMKDAEWVHGPIFKRRSFFFHIWHILVTMTCIVSFGHLPRVWLLNSCLSKFHMNLGLFALKRVLHWPCVVSSRSHFIFFLCLHFQPLHSIIEISYLTQICIY